MSKFYKIPVEYTMFGFVYVEGEDLKEAIKRAHEDECPLPTYPRYVEGSKLINENAAYLWSLED